jgi:hypothetical protein
VQVNGTVVNETPNASVDGDVVIDPAHKLYDVNRFNNHSSGPRFKLLPGNAETLHDDAYTAVWAPYALRRPGEDLSVGIQTTVFRYIEGGLKLRLETFPKAKKAGGFVDLTWPMPYPGVNGRLATEQSYDGDQEAGGSLTKFPLSSLTPLLTLEGGVTQKNKAGVKHSHHLTGFTAARVKSAEKSRYFQYAVNLRAERAPGLNRIDYSRFSGSLLASVNLGTNVILSQRLFRGLVTSRELVPEQALFKPNDLTEARVRIDRPGIQRTRAITALVSDLFFPLLIPLPQDLLILPRKAQWRLFYDFALSTSPHTTFRSYGYGITLPFGGDVPGAGNIAAGRFSLLAIQGSKVNTEVTTKPSIIFDVTGEL